MNDLKSQAKLTDSQRDKFDYICDKCGFLFNDALEIKYQEYAGSGFSIEYASPCCRSGNFQDNVGREMFVKI